MSQAYLLRKTARRLWAGEPCGALYRGTGSLGLSKSDTAAILGQTRVPALIVMGTKNPDFADAVEEARLLARQMNAGTVIVDGAGHYPHTEMPERVAPKLLAFLSSLPGNGMVGQA